MRILVVEDDRKHREELQRTLGFAKGPCPRCVMPVTFEVEVAETVEAARKQIVERGYEFVLLDLNMRGDLSASKLIPLLLEMLIPYAFYSDHPEKVDKGEAPVWAREAHVRMDLVTKISDHYHAFIDTNRKELTRPGKHCLGRTNA
jgi:CheY-like chemotaxis protein